MAYTYTQRFSKIPNDQANKSTGKSDLVGTWITANASRQSKAGGGVLQPKDTQSSDTENASPAIGPKDVSSVRLCSGEIFNRMLLTLFCILVRRRKLRYSTFTPVAVQQREATIKCVHSSQHEQWTGGLFNTKPDGRYATTFLQGRRQSSLLHKRGANQFGRERLSL